MKDFVCPKCRKPHNSEAKFCFFCGEDLEEEILKFKEKHKSVELKKKTPLVPVKYQQDISVNDAKDSFSKEKKIPLQEIILSISIIFITFTIMLSGIGLLVSVVMDVFNHVLIIWKIALGSIATILAPIIFIVLRELLPYGKEQPSKKRTILVLYFLIFCLFSLFLGVSLIVDIIVNAFIGESTDTLQLIIGIVSLIIGIISGIILTKFLPRQAKSSNVSNLCLTSIDCSSFVDCGGCVSGFGFLIYFISIFFSKR